MGRGHPGVPEIKVRIRTSKKRPKERKKKSRYECKRREQRLRTNDKKEHGEKNVRISTSTLLGGGYRDWGDSTQNGYEKR